MTDGGPPGMPLPPSPPPPEAPELKGFKPTWERGKGPVPVAAPIGEAEVQRWLEKLAGDDPRLSGSYITSGNRIVVRFDYDDGSSRLIVAEPLAEYMRPAPRVGATEQGEGT